MNSNNFGDNLKHLRKSNNLTQKELGSRIGLSKAVVSKYENGSMGELLILNKDSNYIVGCITVFCGSTPIRLIDNIKYKEL